MPVTKAIFDKKNILIIGGAGFVGSHLCDELVKSNKVICVDNFLTGDNMNISHLLQNPDFRFINYDVVNHLDLESMAELEYFKVAFQGVQEIYFLASPTSPTAYTKHSIETLLVNSVGLRNALDLAVKYQAKLLFASSPTVYGTGTGQMLIKETYVGPLDHLSPRACFAEAKRFGETLTETYHQKTGINTKIVRIFNAYGPRMGLNDGRMIPEMIKSAIRNEDIVIYGKENEVASYFFIDDLVRGLIKTMHSVENSPINLASEWKVSLKEVAEKIITKFNSKSNIVFADRPVNFSIQPLADITIAKEKLGWFPIILLDEGIKETVDYLSAQEGIRRPESANL
jgi:nucleoside-diphosphate-sugar epimerase